VTACLHCPGTRFEPTPQARHSVQVAGAAHHQEYWIPAEELDAFNDAIVPPIEIIATYQGAEEGA
jgi:hypothetical protein